MSFIVTLFGPRHYYWDVFKQKHSWRSGVRYWFSRPDVWSTGCVGVCVPGLHVVFHWGQVKKNA